MWIHTLEEHLGHTRGCLGVVLSFLTPQDLYGDEGQTEIDKEYENLYIHSRYGFKWTLETKSKESRPLFPSGRSKATPIIDNEEWLYEDMPQMAVACNGSQLYNFVNDLVAIRAETPVLRLLLDCFWTLTDEQVLFLKKKALTHKCEKIHHFLEDSQDNCPGMYEFPHGMKKQPGYSWAFIEFYS